MEMGPVDMRVLGSLIEKQRTTPDVYPLTLNALRSACNQSTNRDPVLSLDDAAIRSALERLAQKRWARMASGQGSRAAKYRQLLSDTLGLDRGELSILGVLMLRGPQTPGELKGRADRLHRFEDLAAVEATLEGLAERGHVRRLERRPGQKEDRYTQLLGEVAAATAETAPPAASASDPVEPTAGSAPDLRAPSPAGSADAAVEELGARVTELERDVAALRATVENLQRQLGVS